ncbi:MAG: response regulator [Gemmatimonadota bacterium]|jgi:two-component system, response regulator PdtaR
MAPLKVLLADDEPLSSMALRSQLEALGHDIVAHVRNGRDAVDFARCFDLDLAVIDYRMPGLTGFDAAARIFHDRPTALLLISGHAEADAVGDERPPAYQYLVKPADLAALEQAIQQATACFQQWLQHDADPDDVRRKNDDARTIQAAHRALSRDSNPRAACRALVARSHATGSDLLTTARAVLEDKEEHAP